MGETVQKKVWLLIRSSSEEARGLIPCHFDLAAANVSVTVEQPSIHAHDKGNGRESTPGSDDISSVNNEDEDTKEHHDGQEENGESVQPQNQTQSIAETVDNDDEPLNENDSQFFPHWRIWDNLINLADNNGASSYRRPRRLCGNEAITYSSGSSSHSRAWPRSKRCDRLSCRPINMGERPRVKAHDFIIMGATSACYQSHIRDWPPAL